jgi:hypothetical protein
MNSPLERREVRLRGLHGGPVQIIIIARAVEASRSL